MTRTRTPLALALPLALGLAACNTDEPATTTPRSGNWTYVETSQVLNTCSDEVALDPPTAFHLDYDSGDEFQIERGEDDIHCEIDGDDFYCENFVVGTVDLNPVFDIVLTYRVRYEGTFASETEAEGTEEVTVSCEGPDCDLSDDVPCAHTARFSANYID